MSAPTFLGLAATPSGVLAAWSDGRVAILSAGATSSAEGGIIGPHFRPFAVADYAALWPETTAGCLYVTGCDTFGVRMCGAPSAPGRALCPSHIRAD